MYILSALHGVELVYRGCLSESKRDRNISRIEQRLFYMERQFHDISPKALKLHKEEHAWQFAWLRWANAENEIQSMKKKLKELQNPKYDRSTFTRCAFVSFLDETAAYRCAKQFEAPSWKNWLGLSRDGNQEVCIGAALRLRDAVAVFAPKPKDVSSSAKSAAAILSFDAFHSI